MIKKYVSVVFLAAVLALTAAVGVSAVEPKKADAASTVAVKGCTGTYVYLTQPEYRSLYLHNKTRISYKLPVFCVHPALQNAARAHSAEMINRDYFSHNSYNGETFSNRLKRYGYTPLPGRFWTVGENIAYNSQTWTASADKVHSQWMNSPGHRANILNKNFRQIGIGAVYGNYKGYNVTMWTADFGMR